MNIPFELKRALLATEFSQRKNLDNNIYNKKEKN